MWKWAYNVLNLPHDYKINDHVKFGWEQGLVVVGTVKKEILSF